MGLTSQSSGVSVIRKNFAIEDDKKIVLALAGNPNTGKSTLFNYLTGLNQHTGNWPGKTVDNAQGFFKHNDKEYIMVDLPGIYSLLAKSKDEEVARDFICFGSPEVTIVITDATCLERNLNLVIQVLEITDKVIVCLNLMDEAQRKGIKIDIEKLEKKLGVPVIPIVARKGIGVNKLLNTINDMVEDKINLNPLRLKYDNSIEETVEKVEGNLANILNENFNKRWIALRLIDGDKSILESINTILSNK